MATSINERRKFLIVSPEKETQRILQETLLNNFSKIQTFTAVDGAEAQAKISNDHPDVIFIDEQIKKVSSQRVVEWVLSLPKSTKMAVVILSDIPEKEQFIDEVLVGKVQFLDNTLDKDKVLKATNRSLNYLATGENTEFMVKFVSDGEELLREGEMGDCVYIVRSGQLEASHLTPDGRTLVLGKIEQGEFVGEMSFINHKPRSASVKAISQCELIEIPMAQLDHILFQKPAWSKALISTLTKRLEKTNTLLKS